LLQKETPEFSPFQLAFKFALFEFSWLQGVGSTAWQGAENTHHWSERNETATENALGQAGSHRHRGSYSL